VCIYIYIYAFTHTIHIHAKTCVHVYMHTRKHAHAHPQITEIAKACMRIKLEDDTSQQGSAALKLGNSSLRLSNLLFFTTEDRRMRGLVKLMLRWLGMDLDSANTSSEHGGVIRAMRAAQTITEICTDVYLVSGEDLQTRAHMMVDDVDVILVYVVRALSSGDANVSHAAMRLMRKILQACRRAGVPHNQLLEIRTTQLQPAELRLLHAPANSHAHGANDLRAITSADQLLAARKETRSKFVQAMVVDSVCVFVDALTRFARQENGEVAGSARNVAHGDEELLQHAECVSQDLQQHAEDLRSTFETAEKASSLALTHSIEEAYRTTKPPLTPHLPWYENGALIKPRSTDSRSTRIQLVTEALSLVKFAVKAADVARDALVKVLPDVHFVACTLFDVMRADENNRTSNRPDGPNVYDGTSGANDRGKHAEKNRHPDIQGLADRLSNYWKGFLESLPNGCGAPYLAEMEITEASNKQTEITEASNKQTEITEASNKQTEITEASNKKMEITEASNEETEITEASNKKTEITEASNKEMEIFDKETCNRREMKTSRTAADPCAMDVTDEEPFGTDRNQSARTLADPCAIAVMQKEPFGSDKKQSSRTLANRSAIVITEHESFGSAKKQSSRAAACHTAGTASNTDSFITDSRETSGEAASSASAYPSVSAAFNSDSFRTDTREVSSASAYPTVIASHADSFRTDNKQASKAATGGVFVEVEGNLAASGRVRTLTSSQYNLHHECIDDQYTEAGGVYAEGNLAASGRVRTRTSLQHDLHHEGIDDQYTEAGGYEEIDQLEYENVVGVAAVNNSAERNIMEQSLFWMEQSDPFLVLMPRMRERACRR
jgi:hypothetical protein